MRLGRRISTRRVYNGKVLSVDVDEVEEPSGLRVTREVTRHSGSVGIVPITEDGQLILVRQYRYPADDDIWEIPAGRIDPGETPQDAAARELAEEVGLRPERLEPVLAYLTSPGFCDEIVHLFRATHLVPASATPDEDERIEVARFPLTELRSLVARGVVREAKTIIALLLEDERQRNAP
jgi:ADP-ribose pyrophosphatase